MSIFNIKANLDISPTQLPGKDKIRKITRGASASLVFSYRDKRYSFENTDQITFMLKQDKTIYWFKMFTYLQPTQDIYTVSGKNYYTDVTCPEDSKACTALQVWPDLAENPSELGYYEEVDGNCSWKEVAYLLDERFYRTQIEGTEVVTLALQPDDTLAFKTNKPVQFEVAIRLNTDNLQRFAYQDTIVIEPQAPLQVIDSLYSQI